MLGGKQRCWELHHMSPVNIYTVLQLGDEKDKPAFVETVSLEHYNRISTCKIL